MKINYALGIVLLTVSFHINTFAQDTIVQWTFPSESAIADGGTIPSNLEQIIETAGGASEVSFKNGATTKAAQATQWNDGNDEKKWRVDFETTGYTNIKLSSKISSGGQNPGPRDFKVQYRTNDGSWTDVPDSEFQTANDWTTGVLIDLPIPEACNDQSIVKLRWIMTSNTATDGNDVGVAGISKIDDIYITGDFIDGEEELWTESSISLYPNPANNWTIIETNTESTITICDLQGKLVYTNKTKGVTKIDLSDYNSGLYIVSIVDEKNSPRSQKLLIQ